MPGTPGPHMARDIKPKFGPWAQQFIREMKENGATMKQIQELFPASRSCLNNVIYKRLTYSD